MTGPELQGHLQAIGLSRKDFAALIGVTYRTVNRWINGEVTIPKVVVLHVKVLTTKK